ncbi:hypothetical protein [Dietzia sp.]|uniref:hypothetical protein n=1 Tax=Dietzia sp. TaxID=1871616 RepID=UPI002FD88DCD
MEPIEINAGGHYLRGLRADERVDDTVAAAAILGLDEGAARERIRELDRGWAEENELSWAVCEQTDPTCLAIVVYDVAGDTGGNATPELAITAAPGITDPRARFAGPLAAIGRFVDSYREN